MIDRNDSNAILDTDSYKPSHWRGYVPGMTRLHSHFLSRGGVFPSTLFFGLQYYLDTALRPVSEIDVYEARELFHDHFGTGRIFNYDGWMHIVHVHGGQLPVVIRAVPEGTIVPTGHALFTVENTDQKVPWLTNWLETRLAQVWYPTTVATLSQHCRQTILTYLERTGSPADIDFKLHDFGFRGSTSRESAAIGGLAHLVNFKGTDTVAALLAARRHYDCRMAGFSIPAAEHSTILSWGPDREVDACREMLREFPDGLVAVVSDTYDVYNACENIWGGVLRDEVLARNGTLVVRPDSGDPPTVVHRCLDILGTKLGFTMNQKGYRVLDPHVRLIQGDGVDPQMIDKVLAVLEINGWSADNVAFGMGGALLQRMDRDTNRFKFAASHVTINEETEVAVCKTPVTDKAKRSAPGRQTTYRTDDGKWTSAAPGLVQFGSDMMVEVFRDGNIKKRYTLDDIRARAVAAARELTPA